KCLTVLAALANVYLAHTNTTSQRQVRLRELLNTLGCENYLQEVQQRLPFSLLCSETKKDLTSSLQGKGEQSAGKYQHIGIYPQRQQGLFYIGVV
ncbi:MAG: precorrin-3B synthase, partial [Nostoc sp.]